MATIAGAGPVVFFDGECNLCNGLVQFIIRHDKKKIFLFSALQSAAGKEAQKHLSESNTPGFGPSAFDFQLSSFILLYKGKYFVRSGAALHTLKLLGGFWKLLYAGIIIPRFLRDAIYNFISRNRYKWFGKRNECMIPTPDLVERFIQ